jgi:branched-chain amino acid transport system substrate-binding protein
VRKQRLVAAGITMLAATLALSACGSRAASDGSSGSSEKVATIGVIAPLSGDLSALGLGIRNSVDLAIRQANDKNLIPGWKLQMDAEDDQASPDVGKNAATKLAGDDTVVGVVGNLNSSVSQSTQPVLSAATIAQISPANTGPTLTMGADFLANPKRPYPGFFRTCTTDIVQGSVAASYIYGKGFTKIATINDKKTYGQGLVASVTEAFKKDGGTIVDAETINPDDKDFSAVISKVKGSNPQLLYYGGEYPQAGPLGQQMRAAGLNVPLMGGDGIFDPAYIQLAGKTSNGDLATSVGSPPETLPSAKQFISDYAAAGFKDPYGAYGAQSFDAANAIINGLKTSLAGASDGKSARQPTIDAIQKVSFDGATGPVAFNEFGDTTNKVITVYKVVDGKWATEATKKVE